MTSQNRLFYLDSMRVVAIFMVVGIHSMGYCHPLSDLEFKIIDFIVHSVAVPVFYLVDGFLFTQKYSDKKNFDYIDVIKKSTLRLLFPWIIFSSIYALTRTGFEFFSILDDRLIIGKSFKEIMTAVYGALIASQLYFLLSLYLIRLFSIVTVNILNFKRNTVFLIFCGYILVYSQLNRFIFSLLNIEGGQEPLLHAIYGFQFYFFGIVLFFFKDSIKNYTVPVGLIAILLSALLFFVLKGFISDLLYKYFYMFGLYLLIFRMNAKSQLMNSIGQNTMGIYLLHSPILLKAVSIIVLPFISYPLLSYLVILTADFWISYAMAIFLRRIKIGRVMMGIGRPS